MIELIDQNKNLSLYIHVPFCKSKCGYCAFYSLPSPCVKKEEVEKYLTTIKTKIQNLTTEYTKPFYTIFIGGGNPGTLGFEALKELLTLAQVNGRAKEVTIEINPEYVTDQIETILPLLTRISIGLQSFDDDKLKVLERNTSSIENKKALTLLAKLKQKYDFSLNGDLICCVPGETTAVINSDISTLLAFPVSHISLYGLQFEEGTPLVFKHVPLADEVQIDILNTAWSLLEKAGFEHYEVSNFAKDNHYCLHNLVYWNLEQYLGFGPTAESSLGYYEVVSLREKENLKDFLSEPHFTANKLSNTEAQEEYLLTKLRTKDGIDKAIYRERFKVDFNTIYQESIKDLDKSYYLETEKAFSLTEKGFLMLDTIIFTLFCML